MLTLSLDDPDAFDAVVYFAHRIPNGGSGVQGQEDFVTALEAFLVAVG